jgi:hypothetical protein
MQQSICDRDRHAWEIFVSDALNQHYHLRVRPLYTCHSLFRNLISSAVRNITLPPEHAETLLHQRWAGVSSLIFISKPPFPATVLLSNDWSRLTNLTTLAITGILQASEVTCALSQMALRHLKKLFLGGLGSLDAAESRQLAEAAWEHLTHLKVSRCELTAAAVKVLLSAPWAQQLEYLHLPENRLGDTGLLHIAQAKLPQLQHLDLKNNRLGTHAAAWCLQQLDLPQLTHLDLSLNRIQESGLAGLCLANLPELRCLNVSETETSHESLLGLELLARGPWLQLEELAFKEEFEIAYDDLAEPECSTAELEAALPAEVVAARTSSLRLPPSLPNLTKLDIGGSRVMYAEDVDMLTSLGFSKLQHLSCDGGLFTEASITRLAAAPFPELQLFEACIDEYGGDVTELDLILTLGKGSVWSSEVLVETLSGSHTIGQMRKMAEGDVSMLQEDLEAFRVEWAQAKADAAAAPDVGTDQEVLRVSNMLQFVIDLKGGQRADRLEHLIADLQEVAAKGSNQVAASEDESDL